jgi:hypothetical protein
MRHHRASRHPALAAVVVAVLALATAAAAQGSGGCLAWGDQRDINARLQGPGDVVELCPNAFFELTGPVVFTADGQRLTTQGQPTGDRRAVLRITGRDQTTAVVMIDRSHTELSHLIIDGNRPQLGHREGEALVFAGGVGRGQVIRANRILEPRSWSALQVHEGPPPRCRGAVVEDNEIGPAGQGDGTWADGISFACLDGVVRRNTIVDATDGAIVVFGAAGSRIEDNRIVARERVLLGAIHLVAFGPYDGDYRGTVVRNNVVEADGGPIRIGIAMGEPTWVCLDGVGAPRRRAPVLSVSASCPSAPPGSSAARPPTPRRSPRAGAAGSPPASPPGSSRSPCGGTRATAPGRTPRRPRRARGRRRA